MIEYIDYYTSEGISLLNYVDKLSDYATTPIHDFHQRKTNLSYVPKEELDNYRNIRNLPSELLFSAVSNVTEQFADRYNARDLTGVFKYKDYLKNADLQKLIDTFEFDKDKFWLLILFIYDFSKSICKSGIDYSPSPNEQLQLLIDAVNSCVTDFNEEDGTTMNKKAKIELHIEGIKKPIIVNNPTAIHFIADSCERRMGNENTWNIPTMNYQQPLERSEEFCNSQQIYLFAKMFLSFFNIQPQIRNLRKKGAKHSLKEMELTSRLVYFTELSHNEKWIEVESDCLKAFLRQYKDLDFTHRSSSIYDSYLI